MAGQWILLAYVGLLILSVVILLCGDWPIFEGTLVQRINRCCTGDAYVYLEKAVGLVCGDLGRQSLASLVYYCCDRPNPILQLFYFAILGGTYFAVVHTSFQYIPGFYVSAIHRYMGTCGVVIGVLLFLMTSFSDPGTITVANVSDYISAYPYDGVLYEEKTCRTCNIIRPARSKHCGICGHCIARFDHHCGWTNNCIGENNLRYFLAFLFWHCCLCLYGAGILAAILAGEVKEQGVIHVLTVYFGIGRSFAKLFPHVIQWLMVFYSAPILILMFLLAISLLLMGFFGYHAYLVVTNTTTNESYKWENYKRSQATCASEKTTSNVQIHLAEKHGASSQLKTSKNLTKEVNPIIRCGFSRIFHRTAGIQRASQPLNLRRRNIYNKGVLKNAVEVFIPYACRQWFRRFPLRKSKKT